jgi:hypothetical protein
MVILASNARDVEVVASDAYVGTAPSQSKP